MSTATSAAIENAPHRVGARFRVGQVILTVLLAACGLVALSTIFVTDDPLPHEGVVLTSSFGLLATVFGLVLVWTADRSRAARAAAWALPLFFVAHIATLGTWLPDAGFAVLAAVGALLLIGRRRS